MKFPWSKESPPAPVGNPKSELFVYFRDGTSLSWTAEPATPANCAWRAFIKWYFCRNSSSTFVMRHRDGENSFLRSDIKRYTIHYHNQAKP